MGRLYSWFTVVKGLVIYLAPFVLAGALLGQLWPALTLAFALLAGWHYYYQLKLSRWLWNSRTLLPPRAPGSWSDIYDGIYRTLRRSQQRRRTLAELVKRFRQAAEAGPDASMLLREDGGLIWCNRIAQAYFGLQWPGDNGIPITNLIRHPEFVNYFNEQQFDQTLTIPSPVRENAEIEIRVMPYMDRQHLLFARDITQLRQLERMRKDFVANVSHELRTPLTVLQGYLEVIQEPEFVPPKMLQKAVYQMQGQSQRMQNLIKQLLLLSKLETGQALDFSHQVLVAELMELMRSEAQLLTQESQHKLDFTWDKQLCIYGCESKLRSAMMNIIENAIKYSPPSGVIQVAWQRVAEGAEFSVTDNGPGIATEHLTRLTERFYRIDGDRNSTTGGTGLGLAIVKHALEHHRTRLDIQSTPGKGSRFSFVIPKELVCPQDPPLDSSP